MTSAAYEEVDLPPLEEAEQIATLAKEIEDAQGFVLIFAVCDVARQRDRLMNAVQEQISRKRITFLGIREETTDLIDVLRDKAETPAPDTLFVFGLEEWIRRIDEEEAVPFLQNLATACTPVSSVISCPLVVWLPTYLLARITRDVPELIFCCSGDHFFSVSVEDLTQTLKEGNIAAWAGAPGRTEVERMERRYELQELLRLYRALPGRDAPTEMAQIDDIALLYFLNRRFRDAEAMVQEAMTIGRAAGQPEEHKSNITCLESLATIYYAEGRYLEAEPLYRKALQRRRAWSEEGALSPDKEMAFILSNLAMICQALERPEEVLPLRQKELKIIRRVLPPNDPQIATALSNLAVAYQGLKRHKEAEPLLCEAIGIARRVLPANHPSLGLYLNNLARVYQSQERYDEAEPLYCEAVEIMLEAVGEDDPHTQTYRTNFQVFLRERERRKRQGQRFSLRLFLNRLPASPE